MEKSQLDLCLRVLKKLHNVEVLVHKKWQKVVIENLKKFDEGEVIDLLI